MITKIKLKIEQAEAMSIIFSLFMVRGKSFHLGEKATAYALAPRLTRYAFSDKNQGYISLNVNEAQIIIKALLQDDQADPRTSRTILSQIQPKL